MALALPLGTPARNVRYPAKDSPMLPSRPTPPPAQPPPPKKPLPAQPLTAPDTSRDGQGVQPLRSPSPDRGSGLSGTG